MDIKPAKAIVILRDTGKQETKSGIYIPEASGKQKPEIGIVVSIGDEDSRMENGKGLKPIEFEVGDQVVYRKYSENKVTVRGQEYNFVDFSDIVARVEDEKDSN